MTSPNPAKGGRTTARAAETTGTTAAALSRVLAAAEHPRYDASAGTDGFSANVNGHGIIIHWIGDDAARHVDAMTWTLVEAGYRNIERAKPRIRRGRPYGTHHIRIGC